MPFPANAVRFAIMAFVVSWFIGTVGSTADEPVPRWKYAPELLRPFWKGDTVEGESVLFLRDPATGQARGSLLFPVRKILLVRSSAGDVTYEEGKDYTWRPGSREISIPAGSRIPIRTPRELRRPAKSQKYELTHRDGEGEIFFGAALEYHSMQTTFHYVHEPDDWKSAVPKLAGKELPRAIGRLKDRQPLTIVLLGDSISSGCNASGWAGGPPYQPPYDELLRQHLEQSSGSKVELKNLSIGGTSTNLAPTLAGKIVDAKPDLVILAFGMNDAAGRPAKEYQANIRAAIEEIREQRPECEFILIASMLGNRDWVRLNPDLFPQYREALSELTGPGVALADMTTIWTAFFEHKKDSDLTGNGVNHPNDFGHRVYAQVLATLLLPEKQ